MNKIKCTFMKKTICNKKKGRYSVVILFLMSCISFSNGGNTSAKTNSYSAGPEKRLFEAGSEKETFLGIIEPWKMIKIGSPSLGIVEKIPVDRGDIVNKGTVLANLNNQLESIDLSLAQSREKLAKTQFDRQQKLFGNKMTSAEEVDVARIEWTLASLETKRRRIRLTQRNITSPIDGVVVRRLVQPGEYIHEQAPLLSIAQVNPLKVSVLLPIEYYEHIRTGMTADITMASPRERRFTAKVDVVDRVMNAASETFGVRLRLENPEGKIPSGVKCKVNFY